MDTDEPALDKTKRERRRKLRFDHREEALARVRKKKKPLIETDEEYQLRRYHKLDDEV